MFSSPFFFAQTHYAVPEKKKKGKEKKKEKKKEEKKRKENGSVEASRKDNLQRKFSGKLKKIEAEISLIPHGYRNR